MFIGAWHGRPRVERKPLYAYEQGPAVERLRAAPPDDGRERSPAALASVRRILPAGRCQLRVTRKRSATDSRSTVLMFAWDPDDPDGMGTIAVPGNTFGVKRPWVPIAWLDRKLQVITFLVRDRGLLRHMDELAWVQVMNSPLGLAEALLQVVLDRQQHEWPVGWFVSRLGSCARCGRELTDPDSQARGVGPECLEILEQLPAVRALGTVLRGRSDAEMAAAWNSGVEILVRMGLARTELRDYRDPAAAIAERDAKLAEAARLRDEQAARDRADFKARKTARAAQVRAQAAREARAKAKAEAAARARRSAAAKKAAKTRKANAAAAGGGAPDRAPGSGGPQPPTPSPARGHRGDATRPGPARPSPRAAPKAPAGS